MKKYDTISTMIVIATMLLTAVVSLFYLPAEIAVQWNENGISGTANKFLILAFPALSAVTLVLRNTKRNESGKKWGFISLLLSLFLFAAQSIITLNALAYINMQSINYPLMQTIGLLGIGLLISISGNRMPKFVQNYYCGVKAVSSYSNRDLWIKTQRFAGKLWFASGLIIMLLSFLQWKSVSILVICVILCLTVVPRIYSQLLFHRAEDGKDE